MAEENSGSLIREYWIRWVLLLLIPFLAIFGKVKTDVLLIQDAFATALGRTIGVAISSCIVFIFIDYFANYSTLRLRAKTLTIIWVIVFLVVGVRVDKAIVDQIQPDESEPDNDKTTSVLPDSIRQLPFKWGSVRDSAHNITGYYKVRASSPTPIYSRSTHKYGFIESQYQNQSDKVLDAGYLIMLRHPGRRKEIDDVCNEVEETENGNIEAYILAGTERIIVDNAMTSKMRKTNIDNVIGYEHACLMLISFSDIDEYSLPTSDFKKIAFADTVRLRMFKTDYIIPDISRAGMRKVWDMSKEKQN